MEEQAQIISAAENGHVEIAQKPSEAGPRGRRAIVCGVAGWILPGLGHALQLMWGRAVIIFLAVGLLAGAGAAMKGNVFKQDGGDPFDKLGFLADLGTGSFYMVARAMEPQGADVSRAEGDYGTRLLATAGVLNLLAALHAYEAARGRKA